MAEPLRIALIAGEASARERVERLLGDAPDLVATATPVDRDTAHDAIVSRCHDACILCPGPSAAEDLALVRGLRDAGCRVPVIVLACNTGAVDDRDAMAAGVTTYLHHDELDGDTLARVLRQAHERHRLEIELQARTELELILQSRLVSHASNRLRAPVASLERMVALVEGGVAGDVTTEQRTYLRKALENTRQLHGIIDALLEVTLAESGRMIVSSHPFDLVDLCVEVIESFDTIARARGIELAATFSEELPFVHADRHRVRQVLQQLIGNALKFTPSKGDIHLNVYAEDEESRVRLDLTDTGAGVLPATRERIFDRLYREAGNDDAGVPGLGLGLYLCRRIVEELGGRIWVESAPGEGSTFSFTLDAAPGEASSAANG